MRLDLNNPLVVDFVGTLAGDGAHKVTKSLTKGLTDEQIARKTKLRVNDIRAALNRLHYVGVIAYSKKKAKNSNWYTYTWFLKKDRIRELMVDRYSEELAKLENKITMEKNYVFFKCNNGCEKLPFELAFEYDFKCPECGKIMEQVNNSEDKRSIQDRIVEIQKFLGKK